MLHHQLTSFQSLAQRRHLTWRPLHASCSAAPSSKPSSTSTSTSNKSNLTRCSRQSTNCDDSGPQAHADAAGLLGLPHVDSPAALRSYWYHSAKPRLDAMYRVCSACGPEPQLLELLDQLVCDLKNMQAKARHCAACHISRPWRDAAQEVSDACAKFEAYLHRSTGIYGKVRQLRATLQQQAACAATAVESRASGGVTSSSSAGHAGAPPAGAQPAQSASDEQRPPHPAGPAADGPHEAEAARLLRLADLLLLPFTRQSVQVEEGLSHLLLSGGLAAAAAGTEAWQRAEGWAREERRVAAAIRAAMGSNPAVGGTLPPLLRLDQVDWGCHEHKRDDADGPAGAAATAAPSSSGRKGCEQQPWDADPLLHPLLARAAALGLPPGVVVLDQGTVQLLLRRHPHPALRQAVYVHALLPKKRALLKMRARLASVRSALAAALGSESPAHAGLSNLALGHPMAAAALLEACADAARPAAEQQLYNMRAALDKAVPTRRQGSATDGVGVAAWDLAYAQRLLLEEGCPLVTAGQLHTQLSLQELLKGLGRLLERVMGVSLEPPTGAAAACQAWAPEVLRLHVRVQDTGAQGVLYVDPGGGYGARQLGFCRQHDPVVSAQQQQRQQHQGQQWDSVPRVTLGLRWRWPGGRADGLPAVWELFHEMGHGLHLLLSSSGARWKHFGGLHLPLDVLEVPSTLMEQMLMHPMTLGVILGVRDVPPTAAEQRIAACTLSDAADTDSHPGGYPAPVHLISPEVVHQLAVHFRASHYSALDFQEQVLTATADHLTNLFGADACGLDGAEIWDSVWAAWSPLLGATAGTTAAAAALSEGSGASADAGSTSITTLKQLSVFPVVCHHQGTYCAYILAFVVASAAWDRHLARDPLCLASGRRLRRMLFEMGAGEGPELLLQQLLEARAGNEGDVMGAMDQASATGGLGDGEAWTAHLPGPEQVEAGQHTPHEMRARPDLARQHACGSHAPCPTAAPCSWALLRRAAHACAAAPAAPQAQRPLLGMKGSLWLDDSPKQRHIPAAPAARPPGLAGEEAAQLSNFVPWWHGHAATPAGFQPSGDSHVAEPSRQNNEAPDGQVGERKAGRRASKRDESDWAAVQAVTEEEERTREIKRCQTWRELQQLFHSHDPSSFNPIHVSALIVGLRTVVPSTLFLAPRRRGGGAYGNGEDEGDHGAGEEGADDSDELASAASSSRRRRIAGAGAGQQSLGRRAARERREILAFAQEVVAASLPLLPRFHPYELTAVLHTLAKAGLRPPDRWLRLALETAYPQLEANRFTNQQLGLLIWSLATLQVAPPPRWLVAFCYASERRMHKPQTLCRKELVTLSWGLATLKFSVPASWGAAFLKQLQQHAGLPPMPSVSSDSSSTSAAAQPAEAAPAAPTAPKAAPAAVAATLEVAVTAAPAAAAAAAAFSSSTSSTSTSPSAEGAAAPGSQAAAYAPGWAKKGGTPARSDVGAVNGAGKRAGQSGAASADERRFLCNCIWAAGALRLRPDATWLMAMTRRCQVMLPACNSWELSVLLWGLGAMGHVPPTPWVQQALHTLYKNMAYAEPEHLARTLYSLAAMGARVGGPPQGRAAAAQGGGSGDARGKGVEGGDASRSGMRGDGSRERGDAQALAGRQQAQDKGQERQDGPVLAPRAFFVRFFQHTHLQLFDFDALSASTSLWALATLQVKPPRDWLDVMLMSLFEQSLSGFGPQELSMSIWALAEFGYRPHQAWMDMFWSQSLDLLPAMTPQHLVQTLRALIKLGRVPPQEWLDAFIQASTACMDGYTLEGQALLLRCFASVERSPGQAWLTAFFSAFMRSAMPQPPALVSAASGDSTLSFGDFSRASGATQAAAADEAASGLSASYQTVPDRGEPPASFASDLHPQPVWHEHPNSLHPAHTSATGTSLPGDEHSSSTHDPKVGLVFEHVAWSLGRLHVQPPEDWTRLFLERAFHAMPHFRQGNLAGLLYGLRVMDLRPSQRWVQRAVETVDAMIEQAGPTTGSLMRRPEKRELSQKVKLRAGAGQESTGQGCSAVAEGSPPSRLRAVAGLLAPVEGARGHKLAPRPDRVLPSVEGHSRQVAPSTGGTQGRLNSVSFRKLVWGIEKLSPEAHARWTLLEIASL